MSYVFYDIFSFIIILFMRLKLSHCDHEENWRLQNQSFLNDICLLLFGDARYTSLDPTHVYFMHFFSIF